MRMRAGQLRHRVEVQRASYDVSGQRGPVQTWQTIATIWASVEPLQGREQLLAKQADARHTHRVTIRYLGGITPRDRIRWGTRVLDIVSIQDPEERHVGLELLCEERRSGDGK